MSCSLESGGAVQAFVYNLEADISAPFGVNGHKAAPLNRLTRESMMLMLCHAGPARTGFAACFRRRSSQRCGSRRAHTGCCAQWTSCQPRCGPRWARVITGPEVLPHIGPGEVLIANDAAQPGRWPFRFWPHRPKSERIRRSCAQRTESQMARLLPLTATRAPSCGLVE